MIRARKVFIYAVVNGIFVAAIWHGFVDGSIGARNVALFVAWLSFLFSLALLHEPIARELALKGRSVPAFVDLPLDVAVTLVFAWHGWLLTAAVYFVHAMLIASVYSLAKGPKGDAR